MGAGKQEPPPPPNAEPPQPVVLKMVLHCAGCAKKVRKSIHHMPGVVSVVADPATNTVVVAGTADAAALKARIEDKTKKPVQILSAGTGKAAKMTSPDKLEEEEEEEESKLKKQPPAQEEKEAELDFEHQTPTTALLRIRLHCDSCADRIRRRIYKIKGVRDVVMEGSAKDEVKVVGTMDVPAMIACLNHKLNRAVDLAPAHGKKDKGDHGHGMKDRAEDKGKGVEVVGPSVASAAASLAPAPAGASTHHVSPYGYGHVAYPQPPPSQPGYYNNGYYGNADDGAGYANTGGYYNQQQLSGDAGGYYQQQQPGGYEQQPYPASYGGFDAAPSTQMFSDEDPNAACSLM